MNIQETLNKLKTISDEMAALRVKATEARRAALEPFLADLAASGEVSLIVIRGYTPGFNDGEPCTHSADFFVNIEAIAIDEVLSYGFIGLDLDTDWTEDLPEIPEEANKICAEHGHVYKAPSAELKRAIELVLVDSIEEDFDTNYYVVFELRDGAFVRHEGDYDCGH